MSRPEPISALTGLRIVGAGWVVLHHFQPTLYAASDRFRVFEPLLEQGRQGVPLFFLLSGFIIWHNYGSSRILRSPREPVRFLWRRFARLWPVNLVTAVLAFPLVWWAVNVVDYWGAPIPDWYSLPGWLASAFMVGGLTEGFPQYPWNQPAWSLTAEMVAYVLFPLVVLLLVRTRGVRLGLVSLPMALVLATLAAVLYAKIIVFPFSWLAELIVIFVAGVLLRVAGRPNFAPRLIGALQISAPVAIIAACYLDWVVAITPLLAVWVWALAAPRGIVVAIFSAKPMQVAGLASYSVYMLHWVVFGYGALALFYFPPSRGGQVLYTVGALVAVAGLSWLCWRFLETPGRRALNLAFERAWPGRGMPTASEEVLEADLAAGGDRA
jgi:peptidoglycan/LPS O-acetylase OafA/YrhL